MALQLRGEGAGMLLYPRGWGSDRRQGKFTDDMELGAGGLGLGRSRVMS